MGNKGGQGNKEEERKNSNLCGQAQEERMHESFQELYYVCVSPELFRLCDFLFFQNPKKPGDTSSTYAGFQFKVKIEFQIMPM